YHHRVHSQVSIGDDILSIRIADHQAARILPYHTVRFSVIFLDQAELRIHRRFNQRFPGLDLAFSIEFYPEAITRYHNKVGVVCAASQFQVILSGGSCIQVDGKSLLQLSASVHKVHPSIPADRYEIVTSTDAVMSRRTGKRTLHVVRSPAFQVHTLLVIHPYPAGSLGDKESVILAMVIVDEAHIFDIPGFDFNREWWHIVTKPVDDVQLPFGGKEILE